MPRGACADAFRTASYFVIFANLHLFHDHPRFLSLLKRLHIHPVWTPAQASRLNLIEA